MNTQELSPLLKNHPQTRKNFCGVFAYDQLPRKEKSRVGYYVVNLDPIHKPGSHWVAMKKNKVGKNLFFDSYGYAPQKYKFKHFLKPYIYNSKQLQYPLNTSCGQWCLFFIYFSSRGYSMKKIFNSFSSKHKHINDVIMNEVVGKIFGTKQPVTDQSFLKEQASREAHTTLKECPYYHCQKHPRKFKVRRSENNCKLDRKKWKWIGR